MHRSFPVVKRAAAAFEGMQPASPDAAEAEALRTALAVGLGGAVWADCSNFGPGCARRAAGAVDC
jgi:hypothetical protein